MRISFLNILDSSFTAFLSFLSAFLILNFYIDRPYSIIFGTCIAILVFMIALDKMQKSASKKSLDKQKNIAVNNMCYTLCLLDKLKITELFERAINRRGYKTLKKKGGIFINETSTAVFMIFSFDGITKTDVVRVFNSIPQSFKAYIFGQSASDELLDFINRFNGKIIFVGAEKTYDFLSENSCLPKQTHNLKQKSYSIKNFFSRLFIRKNAKKFLLFGVMLLLMSAFVVIKFYYVFCASIFITLSLFCRLFSKEETKG